MAPREEESNTRNSMNLTYNIGMDQIDHSSQLYFGPAHELLLIGGGRALGLVASSAVELGFNVFVASSPRYLDEEGQIFPELAPNVRTSIQFSVCPGLKEAMAPFSLSPGSARVNIALGNPWILSREDLNLYFDGVLLNCHGTGLPKDRGGGGFSWRILESNPFGFVNLYLVDESIDTGPILDFEEFLFPKSCVTPFDFEVAQEQKVAEFIKRKLALIRQERVGFQLKSQLNYLSSYWPRLSSKLNGWVDWAMRCEDLERFVTAFDSPYGGARTMLGNRQVRLASARKMFADGAFHPFQSGLVYRKGPGWLCVAAHGGSLIVEEIRDEAGRDMLADVRLGDRFHTPATSLEAGKVRAKLDPTGFTEKN